MIIEINIKASIKNALINSISIWIASLKPQRFSSCFILTKLVGYQRKKTCTNTLRPSTKKITY
ncbi:MAG: hypothetical protein ACI9Q3_000823 [Maribacter sp.]|jgi:hypothetical protein